MGQVVSGDDPTDGDEGDARRVPERGTLSLSDAAWMEARRRAAVIAPLAAREGVPASAARDAGGALGPSEPTIYALLRLASPAPKSGSCASSWVLAARRSTVTLTPRVSSGPMGKSCSAEELADASSILQHPQTYACGCADNCGSSTHDHVSDEKDWRKAAARRSEIGRLPLIDTRSQQQRGAGVGVKAHIQLQRVDLTVDPDPTFAWRG